MRSSGIKIKFILFFLAAGQFSLYAMNPGSDSGKTVTKAIETGNLSRTKASLVMNEWMRDPFITLGPDHYYYLTCTRLWNSPFKPGMEMWRSRDLSDWEPIGLKWSFDDSQWMAGPLAKMSLEMKKDRHLWAPEISYIDGRWVSVFTTSLRYSNLIVSEGDDMNGPWTEPFGEAFHYKHDPSIFKDKAGQWWCTAFLNGTYVTPDQVAKNGISKTKAETINPQGLTLVPMDISIKDGDVIVRALDPDYAHPGDDEIQDFSK